MSPPTPEVSLIVPVIRVEGSGSHPVKTLLDSIAKTVDLPREVILVLNSPEDESLLALAKAHPVVTRYAINSQNAGVARSWNMGAHLALGNFCCFVNQDVSLGEGCIAGLHTAFRDHPRLGMVGVAGAIWEESGGVLKHKAYVRESRPALATAISGFLFMVPTRVLRLVGYFDDAYSPLSYEEIDYAFRVADAGYRCVVVPGLSYQHEWGVSAAPPERGVEWLGRRETIGEINQRNDAHFQSAWGIRRRSAAAPEYGGEYYNAEYFARHKYAEIMSRDRTMDGRTYRPLVKTLADMVLSHERSDSFRHILDIGCAYGYLVQELCARGREAWGIDFSPECIAASPVPERVRCLNALDVPLDRRYDAVVMTDIVEHLSDLDLMVLLPRLRKITRIVYMNINNCRHEPSHINIRSMWGWRRFMRAQGCRVDEANTRLARRIYISQQAGTEMWHKFTFFFNLHHD